MYAAAFEPLARTCAAHPRRACSLLQTVCKDAYRPHTKKLLENSHTLRSAVGPMIWYVPRAKEAVPFVLTRIGLSLSRRSFLLVEALPLALTAIYRCDQGGEAEEGPSHRSAFS